jgi:hypothetical protein
MLRLFQGRLVNRKQEVNVVDLSATAPLFSKEGLGEIFNNANKIPLYPPFSKGELKEEVLKSTTLSRR